MTDFIEVTDETHPDHPELHRVKALKDMPQFGVNAGDLGGWVAISEHLHLALNGKAWIGRNARVWGGTFRGGTFRGGTFRGGTFRGGTFRGGMFEGGTFRGGMFEGGTFWGGTFEGGEALVLMGLPSGQLTCYPGDGAWVIHLGCWTGTPEQLRDLIVTDHGWPEARGEEITRRRPLIEAALVMVAAHIADVEARKETQ